MSEPVKSYKSCQSCGIPMDKAAGHGTEVDGAKSPKYCNYCYKDGSFVQPGWTAADMQAYASKKLQQFGLPAMVADLLTKGIPKLERWQSKENV
ncbi:MAG: zinc ribbon domain-containing protein [Bacteroidota bacterium]